MFLDAVRAGYSVTAAATRAGSVRCRFYELRQEDEGFAAEWAEAYAASVDVLEDEYAQAAREGWRETTYDAEGNVVRVQERRNPKLIADLLRVRAPGRWGTQHVQVSGLPKQEPWSLDTMAVAGVMLEAGFPREMVASHLGGILGEAIDAEAIELPPARQLEAVVTPATGSSVSNDENDE